MKIQLSQNLSPGAAKVLRELSDAGASEATAVAECLSDIAENGGGSATDEFLMTCAMGIRDWASEFLRRLRRARRAK